MKNSLSKYVVISLVFLIISSLISCGKKKISYVYVDAGLKKYFDCKAGSYWVFYDSLNNYSDSINIVSNSDDLQIDNDVSNEFISFGAYGYRSPSLGDGTEWSMSLSAGGSDLWINSLNYYFTNSFPFYLGLQSYSASAPYAISSYTSLIGSYSINNILYDSVYKISFSYINQSYGDTFYINSDHCFLKVVFNNQYLQRKLFLIKDSIVR